MIVPQGVTIQAVEPSITLAFLAEPPAWTRLEPQSVSGDPTPGLEARIHDPLWLLARQWQLGELAGSDAGSPVSVDITTRSTDVVAFQPGDPAAARPARPWQTGDLIEPLVEREPTPARGAGLRQRAEAGAQLVAELTDVGVPVQMLAALLADCPLQQSWTDTFDTTVGPLLTVLGGRVPDAEQAAIRIAAGLSQTPPSPPSWFDGIADPAGVLAALGDWVDWYRSSVSAEPDPNNDSWIDERLEYRFSLGLSGAAGDLTLRASAFGGGRVDWYDFDHDPAASPLAPTTAPATARTTTVLATPLRFSSMPADRYWQFEDGQVNIGALEAQPHDLSHLALAEFALVYGNDWLSVPVDIPYGSFTQVINLQVVNTFGEQLAIAEADDSSRSGRFRLFELSEVDGAEVLHGLLVAPAAPSLIAGPPLEEVLYLRDEMANMAWAVERLVQGPSGDPRTREDEPKPPPFNPATDPGADMDYQLENEVPAWWIPFLPVSTGYGTIALRKGAMIHDGQPVQPLGVLLRPGSPLVIADEEIPRDGVCGRRVPILARRADGAYVRWVTKRVTVGRGEGSSGLAFDTAVRRAPPSTAG
jgi:hypothetical protein